MYKTRGWVPLSIYKLIYVCILAEYADGPCMHAYAYGIA
jgi:hypothetical protein